MLKSSLTCARKQERRSKSQKLACTTEGFADMSLPLHMTVMIATSTVLMHLALLYWFLSTAKTA